MQLTVNDVARLFQVNEQQVLRWVTIWRMPSHLFRGQYRFNRSDLLEWATCHQLGPASAPAWGARWSGSQDFSLAQTLRQGGIVISIRGRNQEEVLHNVVQSLPLPDEVDRELLLQVLLSQQSLEPTPMLNGLALPQPRSPVVLPMKRPLLALCFLEQAVAFPHGSMIDKVFVLVCPYLKLHQNLLARLTALLGDSGLRQRIQDRASANCILDQIQRLESQLEEVMQRRHAEVRG